MLSWFLGLLRVCIAGQGKEEQTNALAYDIYSTGILNSDHEQKFARETKDISVPRCEPKRHFSGHDSLSRFHLFLGSTYPHFSGLPLLIAHSSSHHSHSSGRPFLIAPSSSHHSSPSLPIFQIKRGKWEEDSYMNSTTERQRKCSRTEFCPS